MMSWLASTLGRAAMGPLGKALPPLGDRQQLWQARTILQELHDNLPSPSARWLGRISLRGLSELKPLRDEQWLALAEALRTRRDVVNHLCPARAACST